MVNLVAEKDIAEAAHALDEQIWRLHTIVKRGLTPEENWLILRSRVESAQNSFITTARRQLSLAGDPLQRFSGRPAPDDTSPRPSSPCRSRASRQRCPWTSATRRRRARSRVAGRVVCQLARSLPV
jgi:hypothetical protein